MPQEICINRKKTNFRKKKYSNLLLRRLIRKSHMHAKKVIESNKPQNTPQIPDKKVRREQKKLEKKLQKKEAKKKMRQ
jgi:hypothetical protein